MNEHFELLSRPVNYAVVRLPGRKFPGVVIQGDTLNALVQSLKHMSTLLQAGQVEALAAEIEEVQEKLRGAIAHYETVCAGQGITLPYPVNSSEY